MTMTGTWYTALGELCWSYTARAIIHPGLLADTDFAARLSGDLMLAIRTQATPHPVEWHHLSA